MGCTNSKVHPNLLPDMQEYMNLLPQIEDRIAFNLIQQLPVKYFKFHICSIATFRFPASILAKFHRHNSYFLSDVVANISVHVPQIIKDYGVKDNLRFEFDLDYYLMHMIIRMENVDRTSYTISVAPPLEEATKFGSRSNTSLSTTIDKFSSSLEPGPRRKASHHSLQDTHTQ